MQFIEFDGRFDESGEATVSLGVPATAREYGVDVFVAVEGAGEERIEGLPEGENLSRVEGFRFYASQLARDAGEVNVRIFGRAGDAFRGVVAWARRRVGEEWRTFRDDPTCYGCQRVAIWAFRAGLAAIGIPTIGDFAGDIIADMGTQLASQLTEGSLGEFCKSWFGEKFAGWVSNRIAGDWLNKITKVTSVLTNLAWGLCHDIGPCR